MIAVFDHKATYWRQKFHNFNYRLATGITTPAFLLCSLMNVRSFYITVPLFLVIYCFISCTKEYSYEGGNIPPIIIDTGTTSVPAFVCPSCIGNEKYIENRWSLRDDTLLRCGIIDTAIVNPERTGFTFFGPSTCSIDTGLVMTILLDTLHLNRNITNYTFSRAAFYYYDNVGQTYIYMSRQLNPFTVTLESYDHQTRMAQGTFFGTAYHENGGPGVIHSGKFKVKLH